MAQVIQNFSAERIPGDELRLTDVILCERINTYCTATVKRIRSEPHAKVILTLFRPYVATDDFSHTGGVTCYVGIEEWDVYPRPGETFIVLERKELK